MYKKFLYVDILFFHRIVYKTVPVTIPSYLRVVSPQKLLPLRGNINTIENNDTLIFACNIKSSTVKVKFENSFFYRTYKEWNLIPYSIRKIQNHVTFKAKLKEHMWEILGRKPD